MLPGNDIIADAASKEAVLKSIASTMHYGINHNSSLRSTLDHKQLLYGFCREFKFWI